MKIYCILFDTMPLTYHLCELGELKDMALLRQVGGCYSFASLSSMFTGRLGCDLLEGGLGWETHKNYKDKNNRAVELPWASQALPEILRNNGWEVYIHNSTTLFRTLVDDDVRNWVTNIIHCNKIDMVRKETKEVQELYDSEKAYIKDIQERDRGHNEFHFFCYTHIHYGIACDLDEKDSEAAKKRIYELFEYWDTTKSDSMFWFFGDHGTWIGLDDNPLPEHYLSWVLFKDNTESPIDAKSRFISIRDFFVIMMNKLKLDIPPQISDICSIQKPQEEDRIYCTEDARAKTDTQHATTAVACKFVDWSDGVPGGVLQVTYYEPANSYIGMKTSLDKQSLLNETVEAPVDPELKEALISRISWVMGAGAYKRRDRWQKIYSQCEPGTLLQIIIRCGITKGCERINFCNDEEILQFSSMDIPAGKKYKPHSHVIQDKPNGVCQESWVVVKGIVTCYLYDLDQKLLLTSTLREGDCVLTFRGGHGYKGVGSPGDTSLVYEFKTGPYLGGDKSFIRNNDEEG